MTYNARKDSAESYDAAIDAMRERHEAIMAAGAKRIEYIGDAVLIEGDCLEILPALGRVDAVVTDPPYGIGWKPRVTHQDQAWVDEINFDIASIVACADAATVWGAEYLAPDLPRSNAWLTWVKRPVGNGVNFSNDHRSYATTEIAWSTIGKSAFFVHVWDGGMRAGDDQNRTFCHPSQKPLELMRWCIERHGPKARTILDPFMGSGTTGVAALQLGRRFIGIELDPGYFDIACKRVREAWKQPRLFDEPKPAKPVNGNLFDGGAA